MLEDHLHFCLHLGKLGLVHDPFFVVSDSRIDLLEDGGVLDNAHAQELLRSPILVEDVISILPKLLHVGANEHLAELDEVAVVLVVDLNNTPGIGTTTDFTTVRGCDNLVRTNNGKRNLAGDLLGLSQRLLILVLVSGGLEDVNLVAGDISKNLAKKSSVRGRKADTGQTNSGLEIGDFLIGHCIRLRDHGNEVDACVQARHELNINGAKASRKISAFES